MFCMKTVPLLSSRTRSSESWTMNYMCLSEVGSVTITSGVGECKYNWIIKCRVYLKLMNISYRGMNGFFGFYLGVERIENMCCMSDI